MGIAGCGLVGFGDATEASIDVKNDCATSLRIGVRHDSPPPRTFVDVFESIGPGAAYHYPTFAPSGVFGVTVLGPTGEEKQFTRPFDEENSTLTLTISGSDCPS